jgi:hypothetical protein
MPSREAGQAESVYSVLCSLLFLYPVIRQFGVKEGHKSKNESKERCDTGNMVFPGDGSSCSLIISQVRWGTPVIRALGRLSQEYFEFEASRGHITRSYERER